MSALAHGAAPKTQKPSEVIKPGEYSLGLPDGTKFTVQVEHERSRDVRVYHQISQNCNGGHAWSDMMMYMGVKAPFPPYANPSEEPDDNTLLARMKRFAVVDFTEGSRHDVLTPAKVWNWFNVFFALWPSQEHFVLDALSISTPIRKQLMKSRLATLAPSQDSTRDLDDYEWVRELLVSRASFWQGLGAPTALFAPWILPAADKEVLRELSSSNKTSKSPFKPSPADGPLYARYIPYLNSRLTFRIASSSEPTDVDLITQWHASDRVNNGWRQRLSREEQIKTIQATETNPYTIGLIGEWDGEPWGYVEIYYAQQSNLNGFYAAKPQDRGFHALVGAEKFRGPHRVRAWMGSVVHLMFLLDPSTALCVSEPRLSNSKMLAYEELVGGNVEKIIDFDHKRAALVFFTKERFYQLCPMGVLPEHISLTG